MLDGGKGESGEWGNGRSVTPTKIALDQAQKWNKSNNRTQKPDGMSIVAHMAILQFQCAKMRVSECGPPGRPRLFYQVLVYGVPLRICTRGRQARSPHPLHQNQEGGRKEGGGGFENCSCKKVAVAPWLARSPARAMMDGRLSVVLLSLPHNTLPPYLLECQFHY